MLDDMQDLVDREVHGGEGDGAFDLRRHRGSALLGSWGSVSPCMFSRVVGLKALVVII